MSFARLFFPDICHACTNRTCRIVDSDNDTLSPNRAGSASHSSRLNVYGPPLVRPFPSPGPLRAVEGRDFVVHCPVGGYPIQRVSWTKGEWIMCVFTNIFEKKRKMANSRQGFFDKKAQSSS